VDLTNVERTGARAQAYVDTSVMTGQTGLYNAQTQQFDNITYLKCCPENDFFPDLESSPQADVVFFCSPNNPTGAAASRTQLTELVAWAKKRGSLIVFDAAYSVYISDPDVPKSIFEIPGAEEVRVCCSLVNVRVRV
jgi:LL-diaminopimelate aminotransferase